LKEKLKECSKQLQVYETERSGIADILVKNGIESHASTLDASLSDISTLSLTGNDLVEGVIKLSQKVNDILSTRKLLQYHLNNE